MGFGYGFARHFSPAPPGPAIAAYRAAFTPSDQFPAPHVILGVAVVCAPTDEEADYLATSSDVVWVRRHRGDMRPFPSPEEAARYEFRPDDRPLIEANRQRQFVGSPARVAANLSQIAADTNAEAWPDPEVRAPAEMHCNVGSVGFTEGSDITPDAADHHLHKWND